MGATEILPVMQACIAVTKIRIIIHQTHILQSSPVTSLLIIIILMAGFIEAIVWMSVTVAGLVAIRHTKMVTSSTATLVRSRLTRHRGVPQDQVVPTRRATSKAPLQVTTASMEDVLDPTTNLTKVVSCGTTPTTAPIEHHRPQGTHHACMPANVLHLDFNHHLNLRRLIILI
jgi:hypothetical protein